MSSSVKFVAFYLTFTTAVAGGALVAGVMLAELQHSDSSTLASNTYISFD